MHTCSIARELEIVPGDMSIERYIAEFLKSHGTRRTMPPGIERTRYLLGKLTHRPAYYIWFHPSMVRDHSSQQISTSASEAGKS